MAGFLLITPATHSKAVNFQALDPFACLQGSLFDFSKLRQHHQFLGVLDAQPISMAKVNAAACMEKGLYEEPRRFSRAQPRAMGSGKREWPTLGFEGNPKVEPAIRHLVLFCLHSARTHSHAYKKLAPLYRPPAQNVYFPVLHP